MKSFLFAICVVFSGSSAFATNYSAEYKYLSLFHFDGVAFGKKVVSVMVHAGAYTQNSVYYPTQRSSVTWQNVTDVVLTKTGDHFFGKAEITALLQGDEGGSMIPQGVGVQYWITFADGSTLTSDAVLEKPSTTSIYGDAGVALLKAYQNTTDTSKTTVTEINASVN